MNVVTVLEVTSSDFQARTELYDNSGFNGTKVTSSYFASRFKQSAIPKPRLTKIAEL